MTPSERSKPLIDVKRKARISKGSGTKIEQVNQLMKQFEDEWMKMMQGPHEDDGWNERNAEEAMR
jgi:signal recognition particle subunit SRP54